MPIGNSTPNPIIDSYDDNFIYIRATSRQASQFDGVWVQSKKLWKVPISKQVIDDLRKLTHVSGLKPLEKELDNYLTMCDNIKGKKDTNGDSRLRPYQRVDVEFLTMRKNAAVFNEQRTGKTPTILLAVKDRMRKGIIVCPAGLKLNWSREAQIWINRTATVVSGSPAKRKAIYKQFKEATESIIILSYETLRIDVALLDTAFDVLIIDEAHRLRNYRTKQSLAVLELSRKANHVFPMTGTPAVNHPADVFGIIRLLRPKKYTSYWNFVDRYFGSTVGRFGREVLSLKKERIPEFTELLNSISVQRKREDVMQWIPPITRRTISLETDPAQQRYYNQILETFRYDDKVIPNHIAQLTRLRQVCLDPGLLDLKAKSPKAEFIKEYLEDNDEPIVVFSSFTSFLKRLKDEIPEALLLTGEQSSAEKQAAVDKMQKGEARVMLANIVAGGVGWTLDKVDTVIFTDKSFNPIDNEQAQDRIVPTVKALKYEAKQIITLTMSNTLEGNIEMLLEAKENIIQYVNNYGLNQLVDLDGEDYNISAVGDTGL